MADLIEEEERARLKGVEAADIVIAQFQARSGAENAGLSAEEKLKALRLGLERSLLRVPSAQAGTYSKAYVDGQRGMLVAVLRAMKEMGA